MKKKNDKGIRVNIYLRPEELARLDEKAKKLGWTRSALIRVAVEGFKK